MSLVAIFGPGLPDSWYDIHVHAAWCHDIKNEDYSQQRIRAHNPIDVDTREQLFEVARQFSPGGEHDDSKVFVFSCLPEFGGRVPTEEDGQIVEVQYFDIIKPPTLDGFASGATISPTDGGYIITEYGTMKGNSILIDGESWTLSNLTSLQMFRGIWMPR